MLNFTNLEQSFILTDSLGIDPNTADCYILWIGGGERTRITEHHIIPEGKTYDDIKNDYSSCQPSWSVYALMKLLPYSIKVWNDDAGRYGKIVEYYLNIDPGETIEYSYLDGEDDNGTCISRPLKENPVGELIFVLSTIKRITKTLHMKEPNQ